MKDWSYNLVEGVLRDFASYFSTINTDTLNYKSNKERLRIMEQFSAMNDYVHLTTLDYLKFWK